MKQVFLDLETKQSFSDVNSRDPGKLGVSVVGVLERNGRETLRTYEEKEFARLWPILEEADQIIGFNIIGFDLPALNPYYIGDLLKLPVLDLLVAVNDSLGRRIRLDNLAQASLGRKKIADGWAAIDYYRKGEWEKLKKYCLEDVRITRDLYDFGQKNGFWRYLEPPDQIREFKIIWPKINKKDNISLTLGI